MIAKLTDENKKVFAVFSITEDNKSKLVDFLQNNVNKDYFEIAFLNKSEVNFANKDIVRKKKDLLISFVDDYLTVEGDFEHNIDFFLNKIDEILKENKEFTFTFYKRADKNEKYKNLTDAVSNNNENWIIKENMKATEIKKLTSDYPHCIYVLSFFTDLENNNSICWYDPEGLDHGYMFLEYEDKKRKQIDYKALSKEFDFMFNKRLYSEEYHDIAYSISKEGLSLLFFDTKDIKELGEERNHFIYSFTDSIENYLKRESEGIERI